MARFQPRNTGVRREPKTTRMHGEVLRNLEQIAVAEDKSFAWVVADIVYAFFGLEVNQETVKVLRRRFGHARVGRAKRQQLTLVTFRRAAQATSRRSA